MLSKDEIKQYHDDGYVLAKQVVSPEQLSKTLSRILERLTQVKNLVELEDED